MKTIMKITAFTLFSFTMLAQDAGLDIEKNSLFGDLDGAHILLKETEDDYARIRITNSLYDASTNNRFWDIAGRIGSDNSGQNDRLNFYIKGFGDVLSLRGNGNVGIRTISPNAALHVNGFTKLGDDGPQIKMKELSGTTADDAQGLVEISHGIADPAKIIAVDIMLELQGDAFVAPNTLLASADNLVLYNFFIENDKINVQNNSRDVGFFPNITPSPIRARPIRIVITYSE